jgi:hypothetical protein
MTELNLSSRSVLKRYMPTSHPSGVVISESEASPVTGGRFSLSEIRAFEKSEELSVDQAEAIVECHRPINLYNLRSLSPGVAQVLGSCRYELRLPSLDTITESEAFWLSGVPILLLTGLKRVNARVARYLKNAPLWLDLGGLPGLSVAAARELAMTKAWLSLRGLKQLSPELAQALAAHEGVGLSLRGVKVITEEVAQILANHRGGTLRLSSLRNAPEHIRAILRKHHCVSLSMSCTHPEIHATTIRYR